MAHRTGLEEEIFATELILSELVTNAIRYGGAPIRVRMLHNHALICEVSDSGSTAPHLRYASTTDEGGRGLYLVARFADRWGTRYTAKGKVIWSEQTPGRVEHRRSTGPTTPWGSERTTRSARSIGARRGAHELRVAPGGHGLGRRLAWDQPP